MYLKKLTIQGFKSFANRTTFEFGRGVTAVVGPNGSGKSNVADAIRWVLGEQSSRLLRARRQEDVIFAGGGERAAVGMAEVTLTLDNEDGWLPLEFNEIQLGRRLYRDGDSAYLLNGSRVRLRDLTDLLLQGKVGQNSYTIMGQGLVDEVLIMSAVERRGMVDEAADVRRYRVRVQDAQDRLRATRTNLDRVQLVLGEIEPRLRQLRRQAERAADHTRLAAELIELLTVYYGETWADTQNRITRARANLDQKGAETNEARERVASLQGQLRTLGEEIKKRRETLAQRQTNSAERDRLIAAAERGVAADEDRLALLEEWTAERGREIVDLQNELATAAAPDQPGGEEGELEAKIAAAREDVASCRTALEQAARSRAAKRTQREELESAATADERERGLLERQIRSLSEQLERLERADTEAAGKRKTTLAELRAFAGRFRAAREELRSAEGRLEAGRLTAEQARERLAAAEERRRASLSTDSDRELDRLRTRLEILQRVQAEMLGLAAGTRNALLLATPQDRDDGSEAAPAVEGIVGLLSQHLRVPAKLEVAVSAALENRLHAIVVETEEEAYRALQILRDGQGGRATMLPLDGMRHVYPLNLSKEKGLVGVASKLVRCEERLRQLIDSLLGRIIIVEDIEAGIRTVRRGLGSVVTLDGTVIEPNGIVTGGSSGADDEPLRRLRELEELPERISELEHRSGGVPADKDDTDEALAEATREAHEANAAYEEILSQISSARTAVERELSALHRLRSDMAGLQSRREGLVRERDRVRSAIAEDDQMLHRLDERSSGLEERREALADQLAAASETHSAAVDRLSTASAELAALEGERRAAGRAREQLERQRQRLADQLVTRETQLRAHAGEAAEIQSRLAGRRAELEAHIRERDTRVDDSEPVRDELTRLETHERQVSEELQAAQTELLNLERTRLDCEAEVERLTDHLESLRKEMAREGLAPDRAGRIHPMDDRRSSNAEPTLQGGAPVDLDDIRGRLDEVRRQIRRLGPINEEAPEDYNDLEERHEFLTGQVTDLTEAEAQLRGVIEELNEEIEKRFGAAFKKVNAAFGEYFTAFFGGGSARLVLTDPEDLSETGIDIQAQPPGKKVRSLSLLSGGERSLTAVALLFALLTVNPAPFCVLDEVDAALDEANVGRFTGALEQLAASTQFVVVTHNRRTIEQADAIYGVSMGRDSVSKVLSVRLDEITESGTVGSGAGR